ncbi:MAG: HAMP domain-containing histidine kinase [Nitrospirae bacterium]|nr:HAMP domain-containing histidine kinase [Nitrospirota bacterium]
MKSKIFKAFIIVITAAMLSNFVFEWLIIRDFENYTESLKEDQLFWVITAVEGSYTEAGWDRRALSEAIHWAMMLGLDIRVVDSHGKEAITHEAVMASISHSMHKRMNEYFDMHKTTGAFTEHKLLHMGRPAGTLFYRFFQKAGIKEKELTFKRRTNYFLLASFLIAGCGSIFLALYLSHFLTAPVVELKDAAERIARRDFNVRVGVKSDDELGSLSQAFDFMALSLKKEEDLRKRLISNVAHELRTPLTVMKANVEAMADGVFTDTTKGLENIRTEIDRLIKLVGGIEDITKAEAGFFLRFDQEELELRSFLAGVVGDMRPLFENKGLLLNFEAGEDFSVFVDAEKLVWILRNLMSNALKFTDKGQATVGCEKADGFFSIEVRDTGCGISEKDIGLIFDRFYRGAHTAKEGLGLGLTIVKELVEAMEGRVEVQSNAESGTIFRVILPVGGAKFSSRNHNASIHPSPLFFF